MQEIKALLAHGWQTWKAQRAVMWPAMGLYAVSFYVPIITSQIFPPDTDNVFHPIIILTLVFACFQVVFELGFLVMALRQEANQDLHPLDLFRGGKIFLPVFFLTVFTLPICIVIGGVIYKTLPLLLLPFVALLLFLYVRFSYFAVFMFDRNISTTSAFIESWRLSRLSNGNFQRILLFRLTSLGLNIAGAIPAFLGYVILTPILSFASIRLYRSLLGQNEQSVD